jgi:mannose-6-phosphate isomerase
LLETQKQPPRKINKPWGYELVWAHTERYVAKILFVKAGESLSLQYHRKKEETMFFEEGVCLVETGADEDHLETQEFNPGNTLHLPPGKLHRLTARTDCRIFEVSTPELDDVVRLKDEYGRV